MKRINLLILFAFFYSISNAQFYSGYFVCKQLGTFNCSGFPKYEIELNLITSNYSDAPDSVVISTGDGIDEIVSKTYVEQLCSATNSKYVFTHTFPGCGNYYISYIYGGNFLSYYNLNDTSLFIESILYVKDNPPFVNHTPTFENIQNFNCAKGDTIRINLGIEKERTDSYYFDLVPETMNYKLPNNILINHYSGEVLFCNSNDTGEFLIYVSVQQKNSMIRSRTFIPISVHVKNDVKLKRHVFIESNYSLDTGVFYKIEHEYEKPLKIQLMQENENIDSFKYSILGEFRKNNLFHLNSFVENGNIKCDFEWIPKLNDTIYNPQNITFLFRYFIGSTCYFKTINFESVISHHTGIIGKETDSNCNCQSVLPSIINRNKDIIQILLLDIHGNIIIMGYNKIDLDFYSEIPSGIYILSIIDSNLRVQNCKFIKR